MSARKAAAVLGCTLEELHLDEHDTIVLFYVYTKAKSDDLTPEQLKRLRDTASIIKKEGLT